MYVMLAGGVDNRGNLICIVIFRFAYRGRFPRVHRVARPFAFSPLFIETRSEKRDADGNFILVHMRIAWRSLAFIKKLLDE